MTPSPGQITIKTRIDKTEKQKPSDFCPSLPKISEFSHIKEYQIDTSVENNKREKNILIVDDDPYALYIVTRKISHFSDKFRLSLCHNKIEFDKYIQQNHPDLAIIDICLAENKKNFDGLAIIDKINKLNQQNNHLDSKSQKHPNTMVIAMSGFSQTELKNITVGQALNINTSCQFIDKINQYQNLTEIAQHMIQTIEKEYKILELVKENGHLRKKIADLELSSKNVREYFHEIRNLYQVGNFHLEIFFGEITDHLQHFFQGLSEKNNLIKQKTKTPFTQNFLQKIIDHIQTNQKDIFQKIIHHKKEYEAYHNYCKNLLNAGPSFLGANFNSHIENLDCQSVIENILIIQHKNIKNHKIKIIKNLTENCQHRISSLDFYSLFNNLFSNSIQAFNYKKNKIFNSSQIDNQITISITNDHNFNLTISDNATGFTEINPENLFSSSNITTQNPKEMHGLGTKIIRQIIEKYHGCITAENNPTGGATISITLPNNIQTSNN